MEEYKFPYEKLQVWHMAKEFAKKVYLVTKQIPNSEQFGLTSQVRRAAVSTLSNIAEGSTRTSKKDQAHFSQLAYSSLMEAACQLQLAQEIGYFSYEAYTELRKDISTLSAKINALHRSQLGSTRKG